MTKKEKDLKKKIEKAFDYYSNTKLQNEYLINKLAGYLALIIEGLIIVTLILNITGVFILDSKKIGVLAIIDFPISLGLFLMASVFKVEKPFVKYIVIIVLYISLTLIFAVLTMHAVLCLCTTLIISLLYFNKRLTNFAAIAGFGFLIIGHVLAVPMSIVFDDPLVVDLKYSLVFGLIPRIMQMGLITGIVCLISNKQTNMMNEGYNYAEQTEKLMKKEKETHYEIVRNLAMISENKSPDIGGHIARVHDYMWVLCKNFGYTDDECYNISLAAMLHDVGKLGVDENILSKPGKLTEDEFKEVKKHVTYGKSLLSSSNNEVLKMAEDIAEHHHERWDGKGYLGLKGNQINRLSCMMSVVDVFDALTSKRCYKDAWPIEEAYQEIVNGKGTQFSPEVVDIFVEHFDEIEHIYNTLKD